MAYAQLKRRLDAGDIIIMDGATGTELQRRGAKMDADSWSAPVVLENPKLLTRIHADYIRAGSDLVTANTFSTSRMLLEPAGYGDRVQEIIRRSVEAAQEARKSTGTERRVAVAGSISHMVPVLPGANRNDPARMPSRGQIADSMNELAQTLKAAGVDFILLEMMFHPMRSRLAIKAARATGLPVWLGMSARRGNDGKLMSFEWAEEIPLRSLLACVPPSGIDAAGFMHSNVDVTLDAIQALRKRYKGPLMAYPDSGHFEMPEWKFNDVITPARLKQYYRAWLEAGVQAIGGCCGLTVKHIKAAVAARDAFKAKSKPRQSPKKAAVKKSPAKQPAQKKRSAKRR